MRVIFQLIHWKENNFPQDNYALNTFPLQSLFIIGYHSRTSPTLEANTLGRLMRFRTGYDALIS